MNAQRIRATGSILLCLVMATGCSSSSSGPTTPVGQASAPTTAEPRDIVMVVNSEAVLKEDYLTIKELAGSKNIVAIVRGTVTGTRDVYVSQFAYRILSVSVTETLRGQVGEEISVLEDGGVVPYSAVLPDLVYKFGATPSGPSNPNGYVDFRIMGSRHSEVGDEVVVFLGKNINSGTPIDTEYFIISGGHGRFTLDTTTGQFVRGVGTDTPAGFVTSADLNTLRNEVATARR
jgi:hypothetical protein